MPLWVILLFFLGLTTVTGLYTLRQNGRNGHRNGNGKGHTLSQMIRESAQSSSQGSPLAGKKQIVRSVSPSILPEEGAEDISEDSKHRKELPHPLSDEEPHGHSDSHDNPPSAMREPRGLRIRSREEEPDEEEAGLTLERISDRVAKEIISALCHIEDSFVSVLNIIEKKGQEIEELQKSVAKLMRDQGIQAQPEVRDEEVQESAVRATRTPQAMPETRDTGTGEELSLQRSIGGSNSRETEEKSIGEPLETKNISAQMSPDQADKSLQESPQHHTIGVETEIIAQDQRIQVQPLVREKEIQQDVSGHSVSIQGSAPSFIDESMEAIPDRHDTGFQISVERQDASVGEYRGVKDQAIQNSIHNRSIGLGSHRSYVSKEMQANPSQKDEELQHDISQHSISVQGDFPFQREQSIGVFPESKDAKVQAKASQEEVAAGNHFSVNDRSVQNSLLHHSIGLGSHRSYVLQGMQIFPDLADQAVQGSQLSFRLPVSRLQSWINFIDEALETINPRADSHVSPSSPRLPLNRSHSTNPFDKIPLLESEWLEEQSARSFRLPRFNLDDLPLERSVSLSPRRPEMDLWDNQSVHSVVLSARSGKRSEKEEDAWSLKTSQRSAPSVHSMRSIPSDELEELRRQ